MSTAQVADFVLGLGYDGIPADVVRKAKTAIRDVVGVAIAAHGDEAVAAARRLAAARGGRREAGIIGRPAKAPAETAAFVNAVMATTLDMDDGSMGLPGHFRVHRGHPGGIVVPAALAVAQRRKATGKAFLAAVVAGYEVSLATAWMIGKTVLASKTGCYGAAAAAAKLFGLSADRAIQTFNVVSAHCPDTSYAHIWTRIDMSKEAPGWAAFTAVMAARAAQAGFRATPGFFDWPDQDGTPVASLGREWEILGIYFKRYSACRHAHAPLDGVFQLARDHGIEPGAVAKVVVGCAAAKGFQMSNRRPANIWQAQYSIPFLVATALLKGKAGPAEVGGASLRDPAVLGLAERVELVVEEDVVRLQPGAFAGRVRIRTTGGTEYETFVERPRGDPENPFSDDELRAKFDELTVPVVGRERSSRIAASIDRLEEVGDVNDLFGEMRGPFA